MEISKQQTQEDLAYVREAVERNRNRSSDPVIWILWAVIILVGFPLADVAPHLASLYWLIATPLGLALSWWRGARLLRARGIGIRRELLVCWIGHWLGMLAAIFLLSAIGDLTARACGSGIMILVGLAYFYYGLYVSRPFLIFAAIMWAGALCLHFLHDWAWTILGLVLASSFIVTALFPQRPETTSNV